jgi:hypothetical protein
MRTKGLTSLGLIALLLVVTLPSTGFQDEAPLSASLELQGADFENGLHQDVSATSDGMVLAAEAATGLFLSPSIDAFLAFNVVVPQWQAEIPEGTTLSIYIRTGTDANGWSDWLQVNQDDDLTLPDDTMITGPLIAIPAADKTHDKVQFYVNFDRSAGSEAPVLSLFRLTFIDSTRGPTVEELIARQEALDRSSALSTEDGYPKPAVISREAWCTYPECNYSSGLEYVPVTHLIVHHTVACQSEHDWPALLRAIWRYHTFNKGWGDIAYQYLVDLQGTLYEGHLGGDDVVGTHASGANYGTMSISLMCDFSNVDPPAEMLDAVAELLSWKADQKGIDVYDAGPLPDFQYNNSWGLPYLMGHRDVSGSTACPGDQAHDKLPELRDEVAQRIGFVSPYQYVDELWGDFVQKEGGVWSDAPGGCGFDGHAYYTLSTEDPSMSNTEGTWRPPVATSGIYEVEVYAPYCLTHRAETDGATYTVTDACSTETVTVSHNDNVGNWMSLGSYSFGAGNSGTIHLTDLTETDSGLGVWFDAIRLRQVEPLLSNRVPTSGAWIGQRSVTFEWELGNLPCSSSMRLEVATDANFSELILSQPLTNGQTSFSHAFSQDYAGLYWRVVAITLTGKTVVSSGTSFGIDTTPPSSQVDAIYLLPSGHFVPTWSGSDGGSGVVAYYVDFSVDGVAW